VNTYNVFCSEHDVMLSDEGLCHKCARDYDRKTPPQFTYLVPRPGVTFASGSSHIGPIFENVDLTQGRD
jgi:hypothetical protein